MGVVEDHASEVVWKNYVGVEMKSPSVVLEVVEPVVDSRTFIEFSVVLRE